jgi:beta-glucosidase
MKKRVTGKAKRARKARTGEANPIYKDPRRSVEARVADLLKRMTVEEKIGQMCQVNGHKEPDPWVTERSIGSFLHIIGEPAVRLQRMAEKTRLGIPLIFGIDAIHGHALWNGATVFPTQLAMSSAWNPELLETVGRITAREMAVTGMHWTFSPVLCIARDLRWGRVDETFGEDPYLIGELASAMARGYQGKDLKDPESVLACAKHYAGYSETEGGGDATEADHTERRMRTTFLPAFEAAAKAGCATFMTAYQAIDGTPCSANRWLLTDVLKREWGFEGFVVTDWNNVGHMLTMQFTAGGIEEAAKAAIEAGNDMMMSTPDFYNAAVKLVKERRVDVRHVNEAVRRILRLKFALGLFEAKRYPDLEKARGVIACDKHRAAALEAAYQSMVLLKNERGTLPLAEGLKRIAVVGPNADDTAAQLGDWVRGEGQPRENVVTMLDGIRERAGAGCDVVYARGCDVIDQSTAGIAQAVEACRGADAAIVVVGDNRVLTGEGHDRANLDLSGGQQKLLEAVKETGVPMIVVLVNSKPLSIAWAAENAEAIVEAWNPGMEGGTAVAGTLFGDRNPSGKLTISFPRHVGQHPVYYNRRPGWHGGKYADMPKGPLYAFGQGLSYTSFAYSNMRLAKVKLPINGRLVVDVDVENTGRRAGTEVVQLYTHDAVASVTVPVKELKAYRRVELAAGARKTVRFELPVERLWLVNRECKRVVEPGEFEVMVGGSSRDEDVLRAKFEVTGKGRVP